MPPGAAHWPLPADTPRPGYAARHARDGSAIILQGHGAVTMGNSLVQAVTAMLQLEEQAQMNYDAYCAMGREHPRIAEVLIDEMTPAPRCIPCPTASQRAARSVCTTAGRRADKVSVRVDSQLRWTYYGPHHYGHVLSVYTPGQAVARETLYAEDHAHVC